MDWNLEGKRVNGLYMGLFPYVGQVIDSRVKYGGEVQHTVVLEKPFRVFGEVREVLLISNKEINRIVDKDEVQ